MKLPLSKILKILILLSWVVLFFFLITDTKLKLTLINFQINNIYLAPLIFIFLQMLLSSLVLPCSPITIMAGLIWGLKFGLIISIISTILSSICTFYLGKFFLKKIVKDKNYFGIWNKIQILIENYDWKSSFIAHLNPIFPGSSLGYIFGVSKLTFISFIFGATLGTIPLQILGVMIGNNLS